MLTRAARRKSTARIRLMFSAWGVVLAISWAAPAVAGPAEDVVLLSAVTHDDAATVLALLDKGANVNAKDNDGVPALLRASQKGYLDVVQVLLAKGAQIEAKDNKGVTALMAASVTGHLDIVQALLAKGAEVNAKAADGTTALWLAASTDDCLDVVQQALQANKALRAASTKGCLEVVQALLARGAEVDAKGNEGMTALIVAVFKGHLEIVRALLAKGANVNVKMGRGLTALMVASGTGHLDIVQALLAKGAEVNAKDNEGHTAADLATEGRYTDIVQVLRIKPEVAPAAPVAPVSPTTENPVHAAIPPGSGCSMMNGPINDVPGGRSGLSSPSGSFFAAGDTITVTYADKPGLTKIYLYDDTASKPLAGFAQSTNLAFTFPSSTTHEITVGFLRADGNGSTAIVSCTPAPGSPTDKR